MPAALPAGPAAAELSPHHAGAVPPCPLPVHVAPPLAIEGPPPAHPGCAPPAAAASPSWWVALESRPATAAAASCQVSRPVASQEGAHAASLVPCLVPCLGRLTHLLAGSSGSSSSSLLPAAPLMACLRLSTLPAHVALSSAYHVPEPLLRVGGPEDVAVARACLPQLVSGHCSNGWRWTGRWGGWAGRWDRCTSRWGRWVDRLAMTMREDHPTPACEVPGLANWMHRRATGEGCQAKEAGQHARHPRAHPPGTQLTPRNTA